MTSGYTSLANLQNAFSSVEGLKQEIAALKEELQKERLLTEQYKSSSEHWQRKWNEVESSIRLDKEASA